VGGRLTKLYLVKRENYEMIRKNLDLLGSSEYRINIRDLGKSLSFTNPATASHLR